MQTQWVEIAQFPGYSVSDTGVIRNDETERIMRVTANTRGIAIVGLTKNGVQYKRSVSVLVADTFLMKPRSTFNSPINLDGDRFNNDAANLMWRPRWFAVRYFQQFQQDAPCFSRPVEIIETEELFMSSWEAATTLGLLDREIAISIMTKNYVFPISQRFRLLQ
jgi:hypothetical protein